MPKHKGKTEEEVKGFVARDFESREKLVAALNELEALGKTVSIVYLFKDTGGTYKVILRVL